MSTLQTPHEEQIYQKVAKTTIAVTICGSFIILSGLTMVATIVGLVLATPPAVITSPVLVPASIAVSLILAGLLTSFGLASTAAFIFYWMFGYMTGKQPIGANQLDMICNKLSDAANEIKGRAHQLGHQY
ncbi:oleosin 1-like [Impatiens glandulifera]|uniref:oleosin 1-like n=1 Tax=Impatiens glandulifera TaxID=253017 RepID=UPI001FB11C4A|nr:oleosin 1-like [Impatiens glandulifera]